MKSKNPGLDYLELMYEITEMTLDTSLLLVDWDRQIISKNENRIREELIKLNKEDGKLWQC